uniref:Uncharacterized protein n=1 Tax=Anguilla anguilla TaxID=7936 RepID=A0A0E9UYS2_ANGAN
MIWYCFSFVCSLKTFLKTCILLNVGDKSSAANKLAPLLFISLPYICCNIFLVALDNLTWLHF